VKLDPRILPDMGVKVTFLAASAKPAKPNDAERRPTILVPKAAVRTEHGQSVAFVVRGDNLVERRAVKTGGEDGNQVEVVAGLRVGEQVVTSPSPALQDGVRVVVK
jgi:HlyD family secretion protein